MQGIQSWHSVTTWRDGTGRDVGGGSGWKVHMLAYGRFTLMYGKNHRNIVNNLPIKRNLKK